MLLFVHSTFKQSIHPPERKAHKQTKNTRQGADIYSTAANDIRRGSSRKQKQKKLPNRKKVVQYRTASKNTNTKKCEIDVIHRETRNSEVGILLLRKLV